MKKLQISVINSATDAPIITINGYLSTEKWEDNNVTYQDFTDAIDEIALSKPKAITIRINSGGGDISVGFAIYDHIENIIKPQGISITTQNAGLAASAASIIMMAGDTREAMPNSTYMTHRAKCGTYGDADELIAAAEICKTFETKAASVYADKTGLSISDVEQWMVSGVDKWFTIKECIKYNIIHNTIGPKAAGPKMSFKTDREAWDQYYSKIDFSTNKNKRDMAFTKEFLAKLGLTETATEAEIEVAMSAKMTSSDKEAEDAKKVSDAAVQMSITTMIDAAIASKKIVETQRKGIEIMASSNFAEAKAYLNAITPIKLPAQQIITGDLSQQSVDRASWDLKMWQKKDSKGLAKMRIDDPAAYETLLNARKDAIRSTITIAKG